MNKGETLWGAVEDSLDILKISAICVFLGVVVTGQDFNNGIKLSMSLSNH